VTLPRHLTSFTGGGEALAPGRGAPGSGPSYPSPGEPPWCASCERKPADVLLPFPADVALRMPAQVFPVCGACSLLVTA